MSSSGLRRPLKNSDLTAQTQAACPSEGSGAVDQAPVCGVIQKGECWVDDPQVTYEWVSAYSYRGWCENWDAGGLP